MTCRKCTKESKLLSSVEIQRYSREHFNYLRNNSNLMGKVLSWSNQSQKYICSPQKQNPENNNNSNPKHQNKLNQHPIHSKTSQNMEKTTAYPQFIAHNQKNAEKKPILRQNQSQRNKRKQVKLSGSEPKIKRVQRTAEEVLQMQRKKEQNQKKIRQYFEDLLPYTRQLPDSTLQNYYNKAAMATYGRASTTQPIGGIMYSNHMKTFNVNPHTHDNNPAFYESHKTAINFAKRTKLCQDIKVSKWQKQLARKLGLNVKNQTIKQGKNVVFVDVDDKSMHEVMSEDMNFRKVNRDSIRQSEKDYQSHQQAIKQQQVEDYYENKKNKIVSGLQAEKSNTYTNSKDETQRITDQVIYRHHADDGQVRLGADRHAVTCFVDLNFPENKATYDDYLKNRNPIFKESVKRQDQNVDQIRRKNCQEAKAAIYPSHYLMHSNQQPEVKKMLINKAPSIAGKKVN